MNDSWWYVKKLLGFKGLKVKKHSVSQVVYFTVVSLYTLTWHPVT